MILQKTNFSKLEELLVKNEDKIDKEKMVFNIFLIALMFLIMIK